MEIGPIHPFKSFSPLKAAKPSAGPTPEPRDGVVLGPPREDQRAAAPAGPSGPPRSALVATALIGALGSMAQLFMMASPAAAEPVQQVQTQVQAPAAADILADLTTQVVSQSRQGEMLNSTRMVKQDDYPGLHTPGLQRGAQAQPRIEGAPNFREVPGGQTYGVAQPTVQGLRSVLTRLGAGPGSESPPVVWTSLREEPVVYIQGTSYTLRSFQQPFANLEATGISAGEVEQQEVQLKQEVEKEAQRYGGRFLVHVENPDGSVVGKWLEIKPGDIQTPAEVFAQVQSEGYRLDYQRLPITDEKAPENKDFDALVERLRQSSPDSKLVFNCHAGRGRTTTGIVIGQLFRNQQSRVRPEAENVAGNRYEQGNFKVILELLESLKDGSSSKRALDSVIDQSGAVQNLRTAIARLKEKSEGRDPHQAHESLARGKDYLHRYYKLIAFENYLEEMGPQGFPQNFSEWLKQHPELDINAEKLELVFNALQGQSTSLA